MITELAAQDIEAGGIRVDTGDPWLDLLHFLIALVAILGAAFIYKRWIA